MLDEWRPLLCPFDVTVIEAVNILSEFLPTLTPPEVGYRLIFFSFRIYNVLFVCMNI